METESKPPWSAVILKGKPPKFNAKPLHARPKTSLGKPIINYPHDPFVFGLNTLPMNLQDV